jgi:hypothetical protein
MVAEAISQHPREFVALVTATIAIFAIITNALFLQRARTRRLYLQHGRCSSRRPRRATLAGRPLHSGGRAGQSGAAAAHREHPTRARPQGFYEDQPMASGAPKPMQGREFVHTAGLKINPEASESLLRTITAFTAKPRAPESHRCSARCDRQINRAVQARDSSAASPAEFGYGQIKPTGVFDRRHGPRSRNSNGIIGCPSAGRFPTASCVSLPP